MAYKKDVDDPRESPGFELMELLIEMGAEVSYNDPHIPRCRACAHCDFDLDEPGIDAPVSALGRLRADRDRPFGL